MATSTIHKRTTAADIAAAVALGAMDGTAEVAMAAEADAALAEARRDATAQAVQATAVSAATATEHECAIPGCRHGAAHGPTQPDRQVKLACPTCGAVARMTARALALCSAIMCYKDGSTFVTAARRTYTRKVA